MNQKKQRQLYKAPLVAVGVQAKDLVYRDFTMSFAKMLVLSSKMCSIAIVDQDSPLIHFGRNEIVDHALRLVADYLLMVDSDQVLDPETLTRLIKLNKDIVVANYAKRTDPIECVNPEPLPDLRIDKTDGLFKLPWAATGVMLVKMGVFVKMEWPWFDTVQRMNDGKRFRLSEDQYFCLKAMDAGFEIWCDPSIRIGHTALKNKFLF